MFRNERTLTGAGPAADRPAADRPEDRVKLIDNGNATDPRVNLALEEYVVRNYREGDFLLLYVNEPCVVLGKHQNVLEETGCRWLADEGIRLVRRISGGGTVYHDSGNLNFCVVTDHTLDRHNNYEPFLRPIIDMLEGLGVESRLNNRNSLVLPDGRKFSGNAQFASRDRMMSHGTLLFDSDLERLSGAVRPDRIQPESKAVQSVRSTVANLREVIPEKATIEILKKHVQEAFAGTEPEIVRLNESEWKEIHSLADEKYDSWEWTFGRSPRFTVTYAGVTDGLQSDILITVVDGIVTEARNITGESRAVGEFADWVGRRYPFDAGTMRVVSTVEEDARSGIRVEPGQD